MKGLNPNIKAFMGLDPEPGLLKKGCRLICTEHSVMKMADTFLPLTPQVTDKAPLKSIQTSANVLNGHVANKLAPCREDPRTLEDGRPNRGQMFKYIKAHDGLELAVRKGETLCIAQDPTGRPATGVCKGILGADPRRRNV